MADSFYLRTGNTPRNQFQSFSAAGTLAILTPRDTGSRVVLSGLTIGSNLGGTIAFYWSTASTASSNIKFAECFLGASATIVPFMQNIEGTAVGVGIWANVSGGGSDNFKVTATGFELGQL